VSFNIFVKENLKLQTVRCGCFLPSQEETLARLQSAAVFPSSHEKSPLDQSGHRQHLRPVFLQGDSVIEQ